MGKIKDKKAFTLNIVNWVLSITLCGLGICLCTKASFGLSMIAAPPYIIHCFVRDFLPGYTQGTSEYVWEGLLIIITCVIVRRFRPKYLLSLLTAVISGLVIDFWLWVFGGNGVFETMTLRVIAFALGITITALAIAFVFRTKLPPQVYELVVTEVSDKYGFDKNKTKLVNDIIMFAVTVLLALFLTRSWDGVGIGTVIATVVNAPLIKFFGKIIDKAEKTET